MSLTQESPKVGNKSLNALIHAAIKKISGRKENDICRYLPTTGGGYIHHFTMRKMKTEDPESLQMLIIKYIIDIEKPIIVPPKPRARRGFTKKKEDFIFSTQDIKRMLDMARLAGDKEIIHKLTQKKDLHLVKRELIASIRHGKIDQELWESYVGSIERQIGPNSASSPDL